jgi:hypothetical protein
MTARSETHYIPGGGVQEDKPLDRYLPPIQKGVATTWLNQNIPTGSWLLDPFGAAPDLVIEAAQDGYNVLVSANNPVTRFILEVLCDPPSASDYQAAIATLASTQVGNERLEPHIKSLYETTCGSCNQVIQVEAFLWRRDEPVPYGRIYTCPFCGDTGEYPVKQADIEKAERFSKSGMHRARALERVAPLNDPDRQHVEEALEVYLPRAIYALVTIINKLSSIPRTDPNHRLLSALLLLAFDRANTLWLYPKERQRPRQLTVPPQFREHNIWMALESAVAIWSAADQGISITKWPEPLPPGGGICLFEGRIRELAVDFPDFKINAVLTAFPRPNQAFWTLSALWAGWLWGYEAVEHFKSVLRRRRYDWGWHTHAVQSALKSLANELSEGTPYFGLINEAEPGFLSAIILAGYLSNLELNGIAIRAEDGQAQITWNHPVKKVGLPPETKGLETTICEASKAYLKDVRGEPSTYLYLHAAGLMGLVKHERIGMDKSPSESLSLVHSSFQSALSFRNGFLRFEGSGKNIEIGQWWFRGNYGETLPLSDRIEMAFVNYLVTNPGSTTKMIDSALCQDSPGLTPPGVELIQECLESYAEMDSPVSGCWSLQDRDSPLRRRVDMLEMEQIIVNLGSNMGLAVQKIEETPGFIKWTGGSLPAPYIFTFSASAILGKYLVAPPPSPGRTLIILPGSRSNLVTYKLKHNPLFQQAVDQGWRFIKYRHLRRIAENSTLNIAFFDEQLSADPLTYTKPQIRLF